MVYGTCVSKSGTKVDTIFVQTAANSNSIQSITGTTSNRFDYLTDAIERAFEIGAPYTQATITIKLAAGNHFLYRGARDFYVPLSVDRNSQNVDLIIESESGS